MLFSLSQCVPKIIDELKGRKIISVDAGHRHSVCIDSEYNLYTWGSGTGGCLGHGDLLGRPFPVLVSQLALSGVGVARASAGVDTTMCVTRGGDVYSWGKSKHGRIGQGNEPGDITTPTKVQFRDDDDDTGKRAKRYYCTGVD